MTTDIQNSRLAAAEDAPTPSGRALRPHFFYIITALVFVADQVSKLWIQHVLFWEQTRPVLGDSFGLTLTQNTGGAWGLMPQSNKLFILFAIGAVFALMFAYHRMPRVDLLVGTAFALAMGGALGNLLDRLRYGYVVDFFDVRAIHWPIFNIADSAITLGIVLLLIHFFRPVGAEKDAVQAAPVLSLPGEETAGSASESKL